MSIAIYSSSPNVRSEVSFALERIFLTGWGDASVSLDLLVRNIGKDTIRSLRIVLPHSMADLSKLAKLRTDEAIIDAICQLRRTLAAKIRLSTVELANKYGDSNWPYRTLAHLQLNPFDSGGGTVAIHRDGQLKGDEQLLGFIKMGWLISTPSQQELPDWTWFTLAANDLFLFDISVPEAFSHESIFPNEGMWLRLEFTVPASGVNEHSFMQRMFSQSIESYYVIQNPEAIARFARDRLMVFADGSFWSSKELLLTTKRHALDVLPSEGTLFPVRDWRTCIYQDRNTQLVSLSHMEVVPRRTGMTISYRLPASAFPTRKVKRCLMRLFGRRSRDVIVHELWLGTSHGFEQSDRCTTQLALRRENNHLIWITLALSLTTLVIWIWQILRKLIEG